MLYKNINIITGIPADVEACKTAIDNMQLFEYQVYEVVTAVSAHKQNVYYSTILHEDDGLWTLRVNGKKYANIEDIESAIDDIKAKAYAEEKPMRDAINSFAVFQFNYNRNFIEEAFKDRPHLIEHFQRKFLDYHQKHGAKAAVIVFYMELDTENRRLIADYVIRSDYH